MTDLTLLQLNIEYGGTGVDFDKVVQVVRESGATVAAVQEGCGNMPRLSEALGWPYVDNRSQVVSQLPLLDPPGAAHGVVLVELEPRRVIAIVNVHPPSRRYGPFRVSKGRGLIAHERRIRLAALQPSLDAARQLMAGDVPVVLLGDFNAPSHRDWTEATVGTRPHLTRAVRWPTSIATEEAGLVDAYRAVHPDAVTHPGLTWPAARPHVEGYNPEADGHAADRIDLMFVSPDVVVDDVQIVGEPESPFTQIGFSPWPTDHRGLLARLTVSPNPAPPLVSVARRVVSLGDAIDVRVTCSDLGSVVVVARGGDVDAVVLELATPDEGPWQLRTEALGPGRFDVVALSVDAAECARTPVWVAGADQRPSVTTGRTDLAVGEPIEVRWSWTPGNRADWIAVFPRGAAPGTDRHVMQLTTNATVDGSGTFSKLTHPRRWPLPPGDYTVHLLMDDLPVSLASCDFAILP